MPASHPSPVLAVAPLAPVPSPSPAPLEDPVPASVLAVIELYADQLAKVAFPEIDAGSLRKQAEELRGEAKAVARAREQLEAARTSFATRMTSLTETCARAVAYARIYSDAHPDRVALATAISQLSMPTATTAAPAPGLTANGKRRGRPPKRSAELFDDAAAAEAADAESAENAENEKTDSPEGEPA
jgi:hypothetical protein